MKNLFLFVSLSFYICAQKDSIEKCVMPKQIEMVEYDADDEVAPRAFNYERAHPCAWFACICCAGITGGVIGSIIGIWNTPAAWQCSLNPPPLNTTLTTTVNAIHGFRIGCSCCMPTALVLTSPSVARQANEICKELFNKEE